MLRLGLGLGLELSVAQHTDLPNRLQPRSTMIKDEEGVLLFLAMLVLSLSAMVGNVIAVVTIGNIHNAHNTYYTSHLSS